MSDDRGDRLTDIRRGGKAIAEYLAGCGKSRHHWPDIAV
jgi:hypothetical protein